MAEKESRSKAGMGGGGKKSSPKKKHHTPSETHIKHFKSGGHTVRHTFHPDADTGEMPEDEEHVMPDKDALMAHLQQAVPDAAAQAEPPAEPAPAAAAPAGPAAPAAPPAGM